MSALENVLFSAPCPLSSLSRKEGNNRESGHTSSVLATWRVFGFLIDQKKKKKNFFFKLPNFQFFFKLLDYALSSSRWVKIEKGDDSLV